MVYIRWLHYIVVILYLHAHAMADQNDQVVECDISKKENLKFYCRGSVDHENKHKGSYFCCDKYLYCREPQSKIKKNSIRTTAFMGGCQFPRFELNFFKSYDAIQKLWLSNVGLEELRSQDFTKAEKLLAFIASHNKLTEIPATVFGKAPRLTNVDLSFNEISRIDPMAFASSSVDHPSKLDVLNLANNKIVSIDNRTFAALPGLSELYLSSNLIQVIDASVFASNKRLTVLQLSHNKLTTFVCQYFENLNVLDLMSNSLSSLDGNCLNIEGNSLNIGNNRLTNSITLDGNSTHFRAFSNELKWITVESDLLSLETFNVSQNEIGNIPDILNRFGTTLKFLDVTDNFVGKLNVSTFMKMQNLDKLVLRNTSLSSIQYGTFHHQKKLKLLDISFNQLKTIKFEAFWLDLRNIKTIFVDGNNLTEVNGLSSEKFPHISRIGITENNFTCAYLSEYMLNLTTDVTFVTDSLLDSSHIKKIACNEGTADHYVSGFVTQMLGLESTTVDYDAETEGIDHPATRAIEYIDVHGSTNRNLLVLVLVILCIICVVVVMKNVVSIWDSRWRQRFSKKRNSTMSTNLIHPFESCDN